MIQIGDPIPGMSGNITEGNVSNALTLNGKPYALESLLGSGAVSVAKKVKTPDGLILVQKQSRTELSGEWAEKLTPILSSTGSASSKLEAFQRATINETDSTLASMRESLVLDMLHEGSDPRASHIVKNVDLGLDGTTPWTLQEYVPKLYESECKADDIHSLEKTWQEMTQIADVMALAHERKITLCDFNPNTKGDRIRQNSEGDIVVIDWNVTAPASAESVKKDLRYLGGHYYQYLTRDSGAIQTINLDKITPHNIDTLLPKLKDLDSSSKSIVTRLICGSSYGGYSNINDALADIRTTSELIRDIASKDTLAIDDMTWNLKREDKWTSLINVAQTYAKFTGDTELYADMIKRAQEEITNKEEFPFALIRGDYLIGAYKKTKIGIREQKDITDPNNLSRLARFDIYAYACDVGLELSEIADKQRLGDVFPTHKELLDELPELIAKGNFEGAKHHIAELRKGLDENISYQDSLNVMGDIIVARESQTEARGRNPDENLLPAVMETLELFGTSISKAHNIKDLLENPEMPSLIQLVENYLPQYDQKLQMMISETLDNSGSHLSSEIWKTLEEVGTIHDRLNSATWPLTHSISSQISILSERQLTLRELLNTLQKQDGRQVDGAREHELLEQVSTLELRNQELEEKLKLAEARIRELELKT